MPNTVAALPVNAMDTSTATPPDPPEQVEQPFPYFESLRERYLEKARRLSADVDRRLRNVLGADSQPSDENDVARH